MLNVWKEDKKRKEAKTTEKDVKTIRPIAYIHTDFPDKFGIPRQAGVVSELMGEIVFEPEYSTKEALRGVDGFSHLWLLWGFSAVKEEWQAKFTPTVRPPRLGGNVRMGVFATRSPFRPNGLGLSSVRCEGVREDPKHGSVILVSGVDMMDGTPIYDIKPYIPFADSHEDATGGFADTPAGPKLKVEIEKKAEDNLREVLAEQKIVALIEVLAQDPRPAYAKDSDKIYGMRFAGCEIRFRVQGNAAIVVGAEEATEDYVAEEIPDEEE